MITFIKRHWNTVRCWFRAPNDCDMRTFNNYHHRTMEAADTRATNIVDGYFYPPMLLEDESN